jgi:hypothetical protein
MKRRIDIAPSSTSPVVHYDLSGVPISSEDATLGEYIIRDESLVDTSVRDYNPCLHVRHITAVGSIGGDPFALTGSGPLDQRVRYPSRLLFENCLAALGHLTSVREFGFELFTRVQQAEVSSRFKNLKFESNDPDFSLVVFVAELKEVKKLIPGLRKHFQRLSKAIRRSKGRATTLGDLFSGAWLDFSYGTGAFVRDLLKLWKLFTEVNNKYAAFISGMGKVRSAHHMVELDYSPPLAHPPVTRRISGVDWTFSEVWSIGTSNVYEPYSSLTVNYKYFSEGMTGLLGRSKFVAQRLGINVDPSIGWDLIPLSFVVDWVIPVGEWLHRHRIDLYDITLKMEDAGFGSRATLQRDLRVSFLTDHAGQVDPFVEVLPLGTIESRFYRRILVTSEKTPKDLQFGKATFTKILSGSALAWVLSADTRRNIGRRRPN